MASTIDVECRRLKNSSTDSDKFRLKYRHVENGLNVNFSSPMLSDFEKYRFFLLKNSQRKVLPVKFYYRPDYMAHDEYGTTNLWFLLLYINDIPSIEEFDKYDILVPAYSAILRLTQEPSDDEIIPLLEEPKISSETLNFYSSKVSPNMSNKVKEDPLEDSVSKKYYWVRQKFTVSAGQASLGYLDLSFEPVPQTIHFKTEHSGNHLFDVDYTLIQADDGRFRRISWNHADIPMADAGLLGTLQEGMLLELSYAKLKNRSQG